MWFQSLLFFWLIFIAINVSIHTHREYNPSIFSHPSSTNDSQRGPLNVLCRELQNSRLAVLCLWKMLQIFYIFTLKCSRYKQTHKGWKTWFNHAYSIIVKFLHNSLSLFERTQWGILLETATTNIFKKIRSKHDNLYKCLRFKSNKKYVFQHKIKHWIMPKIS